MEFFKGKIEAKCIDTLEISATGANINNLGISSNTNFINQVFFNDNVEFQNSVTFYDNVEFQNSVTFYDVIQATSISVTNATIENLNMDSLNINDISVTFISIHNVDFLNNVSIPTTLTVDCIEANKINTNILTSDNSIFNQLSVTGPADFYGLVTFHELVVGISGSGSGGDSINGSSGFFLNKHGDLSIDNDVTICGDLTIKGGVSIAGDLCAHIGNPTNDNRTRPIDISTTGFTDNIGLNLDATMKISDGFQIIDHYFKTYFLCPPPGVSLVGCTSTAEDLIIEWQNFPKVEYAPLNIFLPHVIENRIDYVKSSLNNLLDWSDPSTVTIQTTSRDTNTVLFHTQGSGSGLSGNIWNQYNIESGIPYDIRIYGINHHSGEPIYLEVLNKSTSTIGVPTAPLAFGATGFTTTSINTSWLKPIDHDNITNGNNLFPIIERYGVQFQAIASVRYPSFITHSGTQYTTITIDPINSATNLTLSALNPGTQYLLSVSGKNAININYGAISSSITGTTSLPSKPPLLAITNGNTLNNLSTLQSPYSVSGGYLLDGQTPVVPIIRFANINDTTQPLRTVTTPLVRNNETAGTITANTATLFAYGGLDVDYPNDVISQNINGYGFASSVGNYNGTKVRLRIDSDVDFYSSPSNGFYKAYTMWAQGLTSSLYYPASINKYVLGLRYQSLDGGSIITTNKVNFYVDNLNTVPSLSGVYITSESMGISGSTQISGVPTFKNNALFRFNFTTTEMANYFLRNDRKHAEVLMETSTNAALSSTMVIQKIGNTVSSGNIDGTIHRYFEAPVNLHQRSSTLHNTTGQILAVNSGNIQLHTFEISLSSLANNRFDENIRIRITPFNLFGTGTSVTGVYANPLNATLTLSKLRLDTKSIENNRALSLTSSSLGRHVKSGLTQYPDLGVTQSGQCGGDYDHSQSILSGDYAQELQLVNGTYQTPIVGDGYKNYNQSSPNNFYFPTSYTFYDYSSISSGVTTNRYVCFKYTNVIPANTTKERLRFTINGMNGLTVNYTQFNQSNHQFLVRIVDKGDGTNLESDTSTVGWMDACNPVGQNGILTGVNGTHCANGGSSTNIQRDVYIRPGTTEHAEIYIRVGIPQNVNAFFTNITCTYVDTF